MFSVVPFQWWSHVTTSRDAIGHFGPTPYYGHFFKIICSLVILPPPHHPSLIGLYVSHTSIDKRVVSLKLKGFRVILHIVWF